MRNNKETVEELLKRTFLKLRSDYAFKRTFCSPEHKEALRKFLNALFEKEMVVTEITFHDKEVLPPDKNGKRIVYDAYCTTDTGHHFVVEMQQEQSELFGKRMVFYVASCIFRQGETGGSYKFEPAYLIVITDFDMKPLEKRLVNEVVLMERNTHVVFTEDLRIYFLSLNQVADTWEKCKTNLEKQLFLIKNMENMDKDSTAYRSGEYEEMFNAAEIASMAAEDIVAYRNSIMIEMERQSALEFAKEEGKEQGFEEGIEKGIEKGIEQGIEQGIEKGKIEVAGEMKKRGMSSGDIMLFTGLPKELIDSL